MYLEVVIHSKDCIDFSSSLAHLACNHPSVTYIERKSFLASANNIVFKDIDTRSLHKKTLDEKRPVFASPKPILVHSLNPQVENVKKVDDRAHRPILASLKPVLEPLPCRDPLVDNDNELPLENNHHSHSSIRWSPFVFHNPHEFDHESDGIQLEYQTTAPELNDNFSTQGDDDSRSSDFNLDLTPLDLDDNTNALLRKEDADAVLSFLIGDDENGRTLDTSVPRGWANITHNEGQANAKAAAGSFTYSESAGPSWSANTQVQPAPSFSESDLMIGDLASCHSPMFSRCSMSRITDQSVHNKSAGRLNTPPSKLITEKEKFSAISTLTRGSRSRKKARLSPQENPDQSLPYEQFNGFSPSTPSMPRLEKAAELDICWTDTKPYFRIGYVNSDELLQTPGRKPAESNEHLYQVLSSRGSRSEHKRPNFATTPHFPRPLLKPFHSEPNRQIKPSTMEANFHAQAFLTEMRPHHYPSPIQSALQARDMNRVLFGIESPCTSEF
jgi:hypothetical protein